MRKLSTHAEWLRLVEISGPFISTTMLERAFPQGLESIDTPRRQRLRSAYEEWRDAVDENDPQLAELHREWVRLVLEDILDYDREVLVGRDDFGSAYAYRAPECAVNFVPDLAVIAAGDKRPRLFISIHPPDVDLEKVQVNDGWPVPLVERMTLLCRTSGVRLGLVTNGERWMLVNAPEGSTSSHISWYSRLWFQEPVTLKSFLSLLGVRRCFGPSEETLDALFEESLKHNEEVTDTLGEQVRRAVEVLVQCLDKADQDRNRELLHDVTPSELYEAGLTIMMRLVIVLCAEERGLLLLDDPVYDQCYAISTLRSQLSEDADRHGPEVLDRRHDAWARLLAVFRAIYGGINHESLRMPALGGSLFDPDRFPFLEGRIKGTQWLETSAAPLPIDNRTVLLLLEALQVLEQPGGALLLSYKALDVENIGHVYEGLLEHTVARVPEITLGLVGSQKAKNPSITLHQLEDALTLGAELLQKLLIEVTHRSESAVRNSLNRAVDDGLAGRVLSVCGGDIELNRRIMPFANLLRTDAWDDPIIYRANSFTVTIGANRRETGTHYTPKSLTEAIVLTTLEPIVYIGPAEGKVREDWKLRTPEEILEFKVCDPAMGSGAFLVQVCRYLSQRLVESWGEQEELGRFISTDGDVLNFLGDRDPLPTDLNDRLMTAKRLIAEHCIYGVDLNPMAVELGKLSIWLITMAKGYPFGFLDHNLKCGDSLLGIHDIDQLIELRLKPSGERQQRLFGQSIQLSVDKALELRQCIRKMPLRDIRDVETMARINCEVHQELELTELISNCFIGSIFAANNPLEIKNGLKQLAINADSAFQGSADARSGMTREVRHDLAKDAPNGRLRRPFHWALEFPEVFRRENGGFDAMVGNPPFLGGQRITGVSGTAYRDWLVSVIADGRRGSADLVAYFFLRSYSLLRRNGGFGLLAVNTIAEGDTRQVGLESMVKDGATIHAAYPNEPWPGIAAVATSRVHIHKGKWLGTRRLFDQSVKYISPFLSDQDEWSPKKLKSNECTVFQGSIVLGMGFVLTHDEAQRLLEADPQNVDVIFQYINGEDLNSDSEQRPSRWAINFWDWTAEKAQSYQLPYEWIHKRVKPERDALNQNNADGRRRKQNWWKYGRDATGLYHTIGRGHHFDRHPDEWDQNIRPISRVIAVTRVSKFLIAAFLPNDFIYTLDLFIFALSKYSDFAFLQSNIHEVWTRKQSSTQESRMRYTASDCYETIPLPNKFCDLLETFGCEYDEKRKRYLRENNIGLTKFYNRFHDIDNQEEEMVLLRNIHSKIDFAVMDSYGWTDLDLNHNFYEVPHLSENDRVRFTISESSRIEVLLRLALLNKERYEEEVAEGQHTGKSKSSTGKTKKTKLSDSQQAFTLE